MLETTMKNAIFGFALSIGLITFASTAHSQEGDQKQSKSVVESNVLWDGFSNPLGVAVQPKTGLVFVADAGQAKIVRIVDDKPRDAIVDFPKGKIKFGSEIEVGPIAIAFVDEFNLAVLRIGDEPNTYRLSVYKVPKRIESAIQAKKSELIPDEKRFNGKIVAASSAQEKSADETAADEKKSPIHFFGLATVNKTVMFSVDSVNQSYQIDKTKLEKNKSLKAPRRRRDTTKFGHELRGFAASPQTHLVVLDRGAPDDKEDCRLLFFDTKSAGLLMEFTVPKVRDLVACDFDPKSGRLFAIDASFKDPGKAGLYELIGSSDGKKCQVRKVMSLNSPTAMSFNKSGNLFVTLAASQNEQGKPMSGKLIKITGLENLD